MRSGWGIRRTERRRRPGAVALLLSIMVPVGSGLSAGPPKPVLAHYMPWFEARPQSATWGWHWTMNHFDPEAIEDSGRRRIASHYSPQVGPYDSLDPVLLEYHMLLMKIAGIDGVIVDWYGMDDVNDFAANEMRTRAIRDAASRARLRFCLCYEDWTIRAAIAAGQIQEAQALSHGQQTMLYAQSNYFDHPAYLRWASGRPVLLNFGPQYFETADTWSALFSVLESTNRPSFFTLDRRLSSGDGAFSWPPMHLSDSRDATLSPSVLEEYLDRFERSAEAWPAYISSAFPRFHDIYAQAGSGASYGHLADDNGRVFRKTLERAMTNASSMVQLVTWNDFGEGTVIEPTLEHGYRDLAVLQAFRRRHWDDRSPYQTNHLDLAFRFHQMRRAHADKPVLSAELDRIFNDIVDGHLDVADQRLAGMESTRPVLYDLRLTGNRLHFAVGGYVSASGASLQTAPAAGSAWRTVRPLGLGAGELEFSTSIPDLTRPMLFRVTSSVP